MKSFIFILIFILEVFGASDVNSTAIDTIMASVPKNSPEYSLDMLYVKKIKTLKYTPEKIDIRSIKNEVDFLKLFFKLVDFENFIANNNSIIKDLTKKTDLLSSGKNTTQKLEQIYYQKLAHKQKQKYKYLNSHIKEWKNDIYKKISNVNFDIKSAQKNIDEDKIKIEKFNKQLEKLKIELEKWNIAENQKKIDFTNRLIKLTNEKRKKTYEHLAQEYLIIFFNYIKNRDKKAFEIENQIIKYLSLANNENIDSFKTMLHFFEKKSFGNTELFINSFKDEIKTALKKSWSVLNYPLFNVDKKDISLINFFIFIIILFIGIKIGKYYKKSILSLKGKYDISNSNITLLTNLGYYLILIIAFLLSLKSIGLDLSSFTLIAGALSVGIGFGLQNIVSNFVSGIILMFEKSIKIGDYIQIEGDTRGTVVDIKMRSITIRTNDNIDLIVPNQNFIQNIVTNWTLNDNSRRFRIPFGVSYGTKVEDVEKVVLGAIKKTDFPHYKIGAKKPQIIFTSLGDNSINFELFIWVKDELTLRPRYTTSEFLKIIYKALNEAGITIPFPQQDLYVKEFPSLKIEK